MKNLIETFGLATLIFTMIVMTYGLTVMQTINLTLK